MTDQAIAALLQTTRTIAVIGWSPDPLRTSHRIADYLDRAGFTVYRVNPQATGAFRHLDEAPDPIDLVVIFRRAEEAPLHVEEAIRKRARGVWLQLEVTTPDHGALARAAGLAYVEDRCIMVEHERI